MQLKDSLVDVQLWTESMVSRHVSIVRNPGQAHLMT